MSFRIGIPGYLKAVAALGAVVLAGCGGGGSSAPKTSDVEKAILVRSPDSSQVICERTARTRARRSSAARPTWRRACREMRPESSCYTFGARQARQRHAPRQLLAPTSVLRKRSSRPRTLASSRCEPTWRTIPPIRPGSTCRVASTLRPEASRSASRAGASSSESSRRWSAPRSARFLGGGDQRVELLGDLRRARRCGPSPRGGARSCGRARRRSAEHLLEHAAPSPAGRAAGLRAGGAARDTSAAAATKSLELLAHSLEPPLLLARPGRARGVHAVATVQA